MSAAAHNIVLIQPPGYVHALCFLEIGRLLVHSFHSLGIECRLQFNVFESRAVNVVLGYHLLENAALIPRCQYIVYQMEQLSEREGWFRPECLEICRRAREVWDYSAREHHVSAGQRNRARAVGARRLP